LCVFVLVVVVAIRTTIIRRRAGRTRTDAISTFAEAAPAPPSTPLGWQPVINIAALTAAPFRTYFWSRLSGREITNAVFGLLDGAELAVFDVSWNDDQKHRVTQTCARIALRLAGPPLLVVAKDMNTPYELGTPTVRLESSDFQNAFRVQCADERFAFSVVSAAMIEWFLGERRLVWFEIREGQLLVVMTPCPTEDMHRFVEGALHRISEFAFEPEPSE